MALNKDITLQKFGMPALDVLAYICLQNISVTQHPVDVTDRTKGAYWMARAVVITFASREAKYSGAEALDATPIEIVYNPADGDLMKALYGALKQNALFAGATDA